MAAEYQSSSTLYLFRFHTPRFRCEARLVKPTKNRNFRPYSGIFFGRKLLCAVVAFSVIANAGSFAAASIVSTEYHALFEVDVWTGLGLFMDYDVERYEADVLADGVPSTLPGILVNGQTDFNDPYDLEINETVMPLHPQGEWSDFEVTNP